MSRVGIWGSVLGSGSGSARLFSECESEGRCGQSEQGGTSLVPCVRAHQPSTFQTCFWVALGTPAPRPGGRLRIQHLWEQRKVVQVVWVQSSQGLLGVGALTGRSLTSGVS